MDVIRLQDVVPQVFDGHIPTEPVSEVWGCDLSFERGKSYLIRAASGRGKSSLCSYIYGIRNDYSGQISFDGHDIATMSSTYWNRIRQNSLGILFQDLRLFEELNAVDNIMLKSALTSYRRQSEVVDLLDELGLSDCIDRPVRFLSFGQQQRVAFIRMLCQRADFWLLDEPISHLDKDNALIMEQMLLRESKRNNTGVIVTTIGHDFPYDYDNVLKL